MLFFTSVAPKPIIDPQVLSVSEFTAVNFTCTVLSFPSPTISWFAFVSGGKQMLSSFVNGTGTIETSDGNVVISTLIFTTVSRLNDGQYICIASNEIGSANVTGKLSVDCKCRITFACHDK